MKFYPRGNTVNFNWIILCTAKLINFEYEKVIWYSKIVLEIYARKILFATLYFAITKINRIC